MRMQKIGGKISFISKSPLSFLLWTSAILCLSLTIAYSQNPFQRQDQNGDGRLSKDEFAGPPQMFPKLDKNGDGFITPKEAREFQAKKRDETLSQEKKITISEIELKPQGKIPPTIDTHNHILGHLGKILKQMDYPGATKKLIKDMDRHGTRLTLLMPPPQTVSQKGAYTYTDFIKSDILDNERLAFLGGGGSLNVMIQEAVKAGKTSAALRKKFNEQAIKIIKDGAVGFGEMTAAHFSMRQGHPYLAASPDHLLFLALSDIAAKSKLPIDLHMELIAENMALPGRLQSPPNPQKLTQNLTAFETLLRHNSETKIVWSHLGWDNTGYRTPQAMNYLLNRHSNLYLSLRILAPTHVHRSPQNSILNNKGQIEPDWLTVFETYPSRFVMGSDQFFLSDNSKMKTHASHGSTTGTALFLAQLPKRLKENFASKNAIKIYRLEKQWEEVRE